MFVWIQYMYKYGLIVVHVRVYIRGLTYENLGKSQKLHLISFPGRNLNSTRRWRHIWAAFNFSKTTIPNPRITTDQPATATRSGGNLPKTTTTTSRAPITQQPWRHTGNARSLLFVRMHRKCSQPDVSWFADDFRDVSTIWQVCVQLYWAVLYTTPWARLLGICWRKPTGGLASTEVLLR